MVTTRPPCMGRGTVERMRHESARTGKGTTPCYIAIIAVILIISTAFVLAACGAGGTGATSPERGSGAAKFESGAETAGGTAGEQAVADAAGLLENGGEEDRSDEAGGDYRAITPVERIEIADADADADGVGAASELGLALTLLTPEGAILPEAIRTGEIENADGSVEVVLNAVDAPSFSNVNLEIRFDTAKFNPVRWAVGPMFDAGGPSASVADSDWNSYTGDEEVGARDAAEYRSIGSTAGGAMYLGAAMRGADHLGVAVACVRPDINGELSGSGELARIVFERKPYVGATNIGADASGDTRTASASDYVPARTPQYFWDWDYGVVFPEGSNDNLKCAAIFATQLPGDADGDLEVTVADITPIALNYLKTLNWYGGKIQYDPERSGVSNIVQIKLPDLDKNGEVGISDIAEIAHAYQRKYDWDHVAYRQTGENWSLSDMGHFSQYRNKIVPVYHGDSSEWSVSNSVDTDAPFIAQGFEYGLPYWLPGSDKIQVLPFVLWDFDLFKRDAYIASAGIDPDTSELRLIVDFVGDVDRSDEVGVPDITPFVQKAPMDSSPDSLIPFFPERFRNDFCQLYLQPDVNDVEFWVDTMIRAVVTLLQTDYLARIQGLEIDYFESIDSTVPFRSEFKPSNVIGPNYPVNSYDPGALNFFTDERFESASTRALRTMLMRFASPVYVSLKLMFSDGTYAVWPERVLIE